MLAKVLPQLPVSARRAAASTVNSLDPRAKRYRAADKSLQQARNALQGVQLALADLPRSKLSPVTAALESVDRALASIDDAAGQIDEARLAAADE